MKLKKKSVTEEVNENIMSMIIDALKEENQNCRTKLKNQKNNCQSLIRRATIQINRTGGTTSKFRVYLQMLHNDELEVKVIDIFSCIGIEVKGSNVENCHRLGYAKLKIHQ